MSPTEHTHKSRVLWFVIIACIVFLGGFFTIRHLIGDGYQSGAYAPKDKDAAYPAEDITSTPKRPKPIELNKNGGQNRSAQEKNGADSAASATPKSSDRSTQMQVDTATSPAITFDVVRIEPDGRALIAGRAPAGAQITLMMDNTAIKTITVDETGNFVMLTQITPSDTARTLSLAMNVADQPVIKSDETVLILPWKNTQEPKTNAQITTPGQDTAQSDGRASAPQSPKVLLVEKTGLSVLSRGTNPVIETVTLETITYDSTAAVNLQGQASQNGFVQIYLDNEPIATSRITPDHQWEAILPDVDSGVYNLRVDEIGEDGKVLSRIETPFLRETPQAIQNALQSPDTNAPNSSTITVQPGYTLWAIAHKQYGYGILYVKVFEANRTLIRDPNLIYPGQIFTLPD